MSYPPCSYPGLEFVCLHLRELRKCLRNELAFWKALYSRLCILGEALWWPRLTDTTPTLHKPSFPPLPTHPGVLLLTSSSGGKGSGTSRAQTHLPSRFGSTSGPCTWGAECRTFLCTSEGPFLLTQGAWPTYGGDFQKPWRLLGLCPPLAYPNSYVLWPSLHAL